VSIFSNSIGLSPYRVYRLKFGKRGVKDLEKISTALYVTKEVPGRGCGVRAHRITELKPHITLDEAKEAVCFIDEMFQEAEPVIKKVREGET
jgi:hypothetical protein